MKLCSKVFCCLECRVKHELDIHSVTDKMDIYMLPKLESLLTSSNLSKVQSASHIIKHFPNRCLKCLMIFLFGAENQKTCLCKLKMNDNAKNPDVNKTPLVFNEESYKIPKADMERSNLNKHNLETKNAFKNSTKSKSFDFKKDIAYKMNDTFEGNIKVFRTTSTPMQKFLWFPGNNASHSLSGGYHSEIISDISSNSKSATNLTKAVLKENISQFSKKGDNLSSATKKIIETRDYKNSPLDLRTSAVLLRNHSSPSIKVCDKQFSSGNCELTKYYSFSTGRMMESLCIKSALLKNTSLSLQLEQEFDVYGSFRSMEVIRSEAINSHKIGVKTKCNFFQKQQTPSNNTIQITPKCRKGLEKKVIDFKMQSQYNELEENEIFYTPSSSFHKQISPKNKNLKDKIMNRSELASNNKENFRGKIWDVFSSLIRFPSFHKENCPKNVQGSDIVLDDKFTCFESANIDILPKRKRDSYEDSVTNNHVKRMKLISGRKPLDSYKKRVDTSSIIET
ncbi:uncharacterized protein LOC129613559 [Condylostylus longicornis]|uniref:uncharacterized protein LOC129613559 n=1 Tax=Condylostylus longicornis TaxID=2530218 RepID=UPI00244DB71E|nr:uncharacterized protein LOC129613559 [Condylostylus longicornis]